MDTNVQRYVQHFDRLLESKDSNKITVEKSYGESGTYPVTKRTKPNKYGGNIKVTTSAFWERSEYDDGSFTIHQNRIGLTNKKIRFGPLETTLKELLDMGFTMCVDSFTHRKKHSLIIRRGKEVYKLRTLTSEDLTKYADLFSHVRDDSSLDYHHKTNDTSVDKTQTIVEMREVIKEVRIQTDPFEELMLRYPVVRKPVEFVGNQTIREYVKQQLKENRRLQDVE